MPRYLVIFLAVLATLGGLLTWSARADEGWVITSFDAQIEVQQDGALRITETILVDFGTLRRHGIFRDIPVRYNYNEDAYRVYDFALESVTDTAGRRHKYEVSTVGDFKRIKIGDPDREVSGPQSYRITYRLRHVLNSFSEHDELYLNIIGPPGWPVRIERSTATVTLPEDGIQRVTCFQGVLSSQEPCRFTSSGRGAGFETTRVLPEGQYFTIVVALRKGVVPEPQPKLVAKPREFSEYFAVTPLTLTGAAVVFAGALGGLAWSWWTFGRDRRYTTIYYLSDDPAEETRPLLASDPIVIEYQPPEGLRPAQMGVLLDEQADTLDVTATIIDLAVRGYVHITEIPKEGFLATLFGSKEWQLDRTEKDASDLLPYEQTILDGLFKDGSPVKLSDLKNKFYRDLQAAQRLLYADATTRKWFPYRPDRARTFWRVIGMVGVGLGAGAVFGLGRFFGAGLIGLPVIFGGLLMMGMAPWMPRRTALGREMLRRTLGFRQYIATAEKDRQQFNEQQNLFAAYLPYAIVFRCVDKWARAFRDIAMAPATQSWYTGTTPFTATEFSRGLQSFAAEVSTTIASTPGSSGSSGFGGGGGSGGGGGGGGGGSW